MPTHLPAYQWYPGDWRKDPAVQSLSYHDRGVWRELLDIMHEAQPRGCLCVRGRWLVDEEIARILGLSKEEWMECRERLEENGVPGIHEETGGIYSKRMTRDEALRAAKSEAGRKGGKARSAQAAPGSKTKAGRRSKAQAEQEDEKPGGRTKSGGTAEADTKQRGEAKTKQKSEAAPGSSVSSSKKKIKKKEAESAGMSRNELRRQAQLARVQGLLDGISTDPPGEDEDDLPEI